METIFHPKHDEATLADVVAAGSVRRLTDNQRSIMRLILEAGRPVGAYQLMAGLARERNKVNPPTIYRVLSFLARQGLIHRIESLNAFVPCCTPGAAHHCQFMICRVCGGSWERTGQELPALLERLACASGFDVHHQIIEIHGTCNRCI